MGFNSAFKGLKTVPWRRVGSGDTAPRNNVGPRQSVQPLHPSALFSLDKTPGGPQHHSGYCVEQNHLPFPRNGQRFLCVKWNITAMSTINKHGDGANLSLNNTNLTLTTCTNSYKKSNKMQQCIKTYFIFIWGLICFGRHTAHHQEPKTALAASGFACVEGCWTCSCWTLSAFSNYTSNNPAHMHNQRLPVQF